MALLFLAQIGGEALKPTFSIPSWIYWVVTFLTLYMAFFQAWRDRARELESLHAKIQSSERIAEIQTALAAFIVEGRHLAAKCYDKTISQESMRLECVAWRDKVSVYLGGSLNQLAVAKFMYPSSEKYKNCPKLARGTYFHVDSLVVIGESATAYIKPISSNSEKSPP